MDEKPKQTETDEVELTNYSDEFGQGYAVTCPNCKERIVFYQHHLGAENRCRCGLRWTVEIKATAVEN